MPENVCFEKRGVRCYCTSCILLNTVILYLYLYLYGGNWEWVDEFNASTAVPRYFAIGNTPNNCFRLAWVLLPGDDDSVQYCSQIVVYLLQVS